MNKSPTESVQGETTGDGEGFTCIQIRVHLLVSEGTQVDVSAGGSMYRMQFAFCVCVGDEMAGVQGARVVHHFPPAGLCDLGVLWLAIGLAIEFEHRIATNHDSAG